MKQQLVACSWHQPKNAIVNQKTGNPIAEDIVRQVKVETHGICYQCAVKNFGDRAQKVIEKFEAMTEQRC
jgi:hypothetical protein